MALHHKIMHHVNKHKARVVAHIQKHHTKYLFGAGIISGVGVFKLIGVIAIFFGVTYMGGGSLGGDYYDAEYYLQQIIKDVSISTSAITGTETMTGCSNTGINLSGTTEGCPILPK